MKHTRKVLSFIAALCALPTGLVYAQSRSVAQFTTTFPFYVGDRQMPAGSYTVTKPDFGESLLQIQDSDQTQAAFVMYNPTQSTDPAAQGLATFQQYGDTDYLSNLTIAGDVIGMEIPESKAEKKAARTEREDASTKSVALQSVVAGL